MTDVANRPDLLAGVRFHAPPALPPRDPRFIPAPAELAMLAGEYAGTLPPGQWHVEEKFDGIRAIYNGDRLITREGEPIQCADHVLPALARLQARFDCPMVLDGEYVEEGGFLATLAALSSRGRKGGRGTLHLFDAVPVDRWGADDCPTPLHERQRLLRVAMGDWRPDHIRLVDTLAVANDAAVQARATEIWEREGEGILVKDSRSLYRRRRSDRWLKLKTHLSLVARLVEVLHDGAAARVAIEGKVLRVAVAMGIRNAIRASAVGMTVRVEAMEWTAKGALRQGRITGIGESPCRAS